MCVCVYVCVCVCDKSKKLTIYAMSVSLQNFIFLPHYIVYALAGNLIFGLALVAVRKTLCLCGQRSEGVFSFSPYIHQRR